MKKVIAYASAATLLLAVSSTLKADYNLCKAAICSKATSKAADEVKFTATFETDPFTILIPGNHF